MGNKCLKIRAQSLSESKLNKLVDEDSIPVNTVVTSPLRCQENNASEKTSLMYDLNPNSNKDQGKVKFICGNHDIIVKNVLKNEALKGVNAQISKKISKLRLLIENDIKRSIKRRQQCSEVKFNQEIKLAGRMSENKDVRPKNGEAVSRSDKYDIEAQGNLPQRKETYQGKDGTCIKNDQSHLTWSRINNQLTDNLARLKRQSNDDFKHTTKVEGPLIAKFRSAAAKLASDSANIDPILNKRQVCVVFNSPSTDSHEKKRTDWKFKDVSNILPVTRFKAVTVSNQMPVKKAINVSSPTKVAQSKVKSPKPPKKNSLKQSDSSDTKKQIMNGKRGRIFSLDNITKINMAEPQLPKAKKQTLESGVKAFQQNRLEEDA